MPKATDFHYADPPSRTSSATGCVVLGPGAGQTPLDDAAANELPFVSTGLSVGTAGDLKLTWADGSVSTLPAACLAAGLYPFRVRKVWATGTTAANLVAYKGHL